MPDDVKANGSSAFEREQVATRDARNREYRESIEQLRAVAACRGTTPASPGISLPRGTVRGFRAQGRTRKRKEPRYALARRSARR